MSLNRFVSSYDLSQILGISQRRVQQLTSEGILKKNDDEKYEITPSISTYFKYKYNHKSKVYKAQSISTRVRF
ncbi:MAG TPA: hypothetical protein DHV55_09200 [Clostridiaceae bacterium]|nr:hypothetical protein [Clostridiaceae bacterium]